MCGRYVVVSELKAIEKKFNVQAGDSSLFQANFNIGPGSYAPIVRQDDPGVLHMSQFGLTPFWADKRMYLFNARSEGDHNKSDDPNYRGAKGIIHKPAFRKPIRSQRCLVIADAFYEGPQTEKLSKPYLIYRIKGDHPFAFAGLYDYWTDRETGEVLCSHSIITSYSNQLLRKIGHHRSPVVIPEPRYDNWLDSSATLNEISDLLLPPDHKEWNAYPVSPRMKDPRENDANLLEPTGERLELEFDYELVQHIKLFGMGQSPARDRRLKEDP